MALRTRWLTVSALLLIPLSALAEEAPEEEDSPASEESPNEEDTGEEHGEEHGDKHGVRHGGGHSGAQHKVLFGAKGVVTGAFSHGHAAAHGGAAAYLAGIVHPRWLELELNVKALNGAGAVNLPIELLVKKPFHAGKTVHPFVGLGPMVSIVIPTHADTPASSSHAIAPEPKADEIHDDGNADADTKTHAYFGLEGAAGTYLWFTSHVGLVVEATYGIIFEGEGVGHELGGAFGVLFGF